MLRLILRYIKDIFADSSVILFTLFDLIGIIIFFYPTINTEIETYLLEARIVGISLIAISFFLANVRLYKKHQQEIIALQNKLAPKLDISISKVSGHEELYANQPLDFWGAKLRLTNTGVEPAFFSGVSVELLFQKPNHKSLFAAIIATFLGSRFDFRPVFFLSIPIYKNGIVIIGSQDAITERNPPIHIGISDDHPIAEAKEFYIADWETRQPITILPHQEYRGPLKGETKVLTIFGKFPSGFGKQLFEDGYYVRRFGFKFFSDRGTYYLKTDRPPQKSVDPDLRQQLGKLESIIQRNHSHLAEKKSLKPLHIKTPFYSIMSDDIRNVDVRVLPF